MGIRGFASVAGLLFFAQFNSVAGQKPVITVVTAQSTLLENPNVVTRTTTSSTLSSTRISNATFTIRSDLIVPSNLTVQYTVSGTALAGKDYQALSGSVTIPAGQTSASITVSPIDDAEDELDETVVITVTATLRSPYTTTRPSAARTTILDDDNVRIIALELSPDTILGGLTRDMRVTVSGAAPPGGLVVSVTSANANVVPAAQTTIAAGTRVGLVRIATAAVSAGIAVPLTVREANGSSASATLVVLKEPAISAVAFRFWDNYGGKDYSGSVLFDSPAPPGGWTVPVSLSVASPSGAALPASGPATVTAVAGRTSAILSLTTQRVSVHTQVEVRAGSGSGSAARIIDVHPLPTVQSINITPDPVLSSDSVDVRVRLAEPVGPRFGYQQLYVHGNAPVELPADPRLRFSYGGQETTIRIGTSSVASNTAAVLRVGNYEDPASTANASFTVTPPTPRFVAFRFWDNFGGKDYNGSVSINALAPAAGLTVPVTLTVVSPPGAALPASAPATVTVQGGRSSATLTVSSQPVSTHTRVEVKAGSGPNTASRIIDIYPVPEVESITVTPDPVTGPDTIDVRVRLKEPVGPRFGYNAFVLTGSGPVSVPTNTRASFASGAGETTVRLGTNPVTSPTQATVTVTDASQQAATTESFKVAPTAPTPSVTTVSFGTANVVGGRSASATVSLSGPVPTGRTLSINLSTTDPVLAPASAVLTVSAGQSSGTVTVQTRTVTQIMQGTLVATVPGGGAVTGTLVVSPVPMVLSTLTLNPAQVDGGQPATGTVTLNAPAPAGGTVVNIAADQPQAVTVPGTVHIGAGFQAVNFTITTTTVGSDTDARITASLPTGQIIRALRVLAVPALRATLNSLTMNPAQVDGGLPATGTVTLTAPAPAGGTDVSLAANQPQAVTVPSTVHIAAGSQTADFAVATTTVGSDIDARITASLPTGQIIRALRVLAVPPRLASLSFAAPTVNAGADVVGRVDLVDPAPGPVTVTLQASNTTAASVPPTVTIPAGQTRGTFRLTGGPVTSPTPVRVNASVGAAPVEATVTVEPVAPTVAAVTAPANVFGGGTVAVSVSLTTITSSPMTVPLSSNDPAIPAVTIQIPAGQSSGTANVRTAAVGTQRNVRLGEVQGSVGTRIQVQPLPIDRVQFPGSIRAGEDLRIEIRLLQPAPAGGLRVPLATSSPAMVALPQFVDVAAGATSATITVRVQPGTDEQVTISAGVSPGAATRTVRVR